MLFTNAYHLGFPANTFDIAISGFMGWYDCFDFTRMAFTQPDLKTGEIWRVLRDGGRLVACSWEVQEGVTWMEEAMLRHYPALLEDSEYLRRRPIGMAYETPEAYEIILQAGGFKETKSTKETMTFVSTDEEEWWRQMWNLGWDSFIQKIEDEDASRLQELKEAIFSDLQNNKHADGIHFDKTVFFVTGIK